VPEAAQPEMHPFPFPAQQPGKLAQKEPGGHWLLAVHPVQTTVARLPQVPTEVPVCSRVCTQTPQVVHGGNGLLVQFLNGTYGQVG
jgi:hypothetical protein